MLCKRIIPCLDVKDGRVVKGINFVGLRDAGDPVESAKYYNGQGADELVFLDITASCEMRDTIVEVVERTAREVFMPLTVGGGVRSTDDFRRLLLAGADKVAVNSAAILDPTLIDRAADRFGSQCVVVAIDAKKVGESWHVYRNGGRIDMGLDAVEWVREAQKRGAGEILLTSMDTDGTKSGFDLPLTSAVTGTLDIPVIASGGGGSKEDFYDALAVAGADAALAATLFHYRELTVGEVKEYLKERNVPVRL